VYCSNCGAAIHAGMKFCNLCGKPIDPLMAGPAQAVTPSAAPAAATAFPSATARARLEKHLKVLGILWIIMSLMRLIPGIALFFFKDLFTGFMPGPARLFFLPIAGFIGVLLVGTSVAGLAAGVGLLERRSWARVLAIVLGIISLIHMPFGTALGIYTLWVLMPAESEREYRRLAGAA
jgi:hypothetical protein